MPAGSQQSSESIAPWVTLSVAKLECSPLCRWTEPEAEASQQFSAGLGLPEHVTACSQ